MILTGKCKTDFENWLEKQACAPYKVVFWDTPTIIRQAYIIDWLDSISLKIITIPTCFIDDWGVDVFEYTECLQTNLSSRADAQKAGIIKINEIYNYENGIHIKN